MYMVTAASFSQGLICKTTHSVQVTVLPNPTVTAAATKSAFCTGETTTLTASGGQSYIWTGSTATGSMITYTPAQANSMFIGVTAVDANNCKSTTGVALKVSSCTGINENVAPAASVKVYPNPNNGVFAISSDVDANLQLINQLGQQIMIIAVHAGNSQQISTDNLPNGVYFLSGTSSQGKINQKIIIQK
jgi:hypothetical protein